MELSIRHAQAGAVMAQALAVSQVVELRHQPSGRHADQQTEPARQQGGL